MEKETGIWIRELIAADRLSEFYKSMAWEKLRAEVLREDKHECQMCKSRGWYRKATTVHHQRHVRSYPNLALSKHYYHQGKQQRNLISLCHACHEEIHDHRQKEKAEPLTPERW